MKYENYFSINIYQTKHKQRKYFVMCAMTKQNIVPAKKYISF